MWVFIHNGMFSWSIQEQRSFKYVERKTWPCSCARHIFVVDTEDTPPFNLIHFSKSWLHFLVYSHFHWRSLLICTSGICAAFGFSFFLLLLKKKVQKWNQLLHILFSPWNADWKMENSTRSGIKPRGNLLNSPHTRGSVLGLVNAARPCPCGFSEAVAQEL